MRRSNASDASLRSVAERDARETHGRATRSRRSATCRAGTSSGSGGDSGDVAGQLMPDLGRREHRDPQRRAAADHLQALTRFADQQLAATAACATARRRTAARGRAAESAIVAGMRRCRAIRSRGRSRPAIRTTGSSGRDDRLIGAPVQPPAVHQSLAVDVHDLAIARDDWHARAAGTASQEDCAKYRREWSSYRRRFSEQRDEGRFVACGAGCRCSLALPFKGRVGWGWSSRRKPPTRRPGESPPTSSSRRRPGPSAFAFALLLLATTAPASLRVPRASLRAGHFSCLPKEK